MSEAFVAVFIATKQACEIGNETIGQVLDILDNLKLNVGDEALTAEFTDTCKQVDKGHEESLDMFLGAAILLIGQVLILVYWMK